MSFKLTENRLDNYRRTISLKTILMNPENSKANEPHVFVLNLSQRLDLIRLG